MTTAGHHHNHASTPERRGPLGLVLTITIGILCAEIVGGLFAHSLVLFADAGHMATDVAGIGFSLLASWFATRPPTETRTFGYQRTEILAAVVNAVLLFGVGIAVIAESVWRLTRPEKSNPTVMLIFGAIALVGNSISVILLRRHQSESLNLRGAFLEVCSDLLGAAAVLVAALVIDITGYERADPLASIVIGALILPRTVRLLQSAVDVLLEATPRNVDLAEVRQHICDTPGVIDVHDLHAWTVTSGVPVLSAHVVVADAILKSGQAGQILDRLSDCLSGHFDVEHCTFQLEPTTHQEHEHSLHA